jgi:hypothetical protein
MAIGSKREDRNLTRITQNQMEAENHDRREFRRFCEALDPILPGYQSSIFSYIAFRKEDRYILSQARLWLHPTPINARLGAFKSTSVCAGAFAVATSADKTLRFIRDAMSGSIKTPNNEILFPSEAGGRYDISYLPLDNDGVKSQRRERRLNIRGQRRHLESNQEIDWELRASIPPFNGIRDLCEQFSVGPLTGDSSNIEVIAPNITAISEKSRVQETDVEIEVELALGLSPKLCSVSIRMLEQLKVSQRHAYSGDEITWTSTDSIQLGKIQLQVPTGAVLDCTACYAGTAYSYRWLGDPKLSENPRRAAIEPFDPGLEGLKEMLGRLQGKGQRTREFEVAISRLLWLLGFAPSHLGMTAQTEEAPDVIAFTPSGNALIVECTTALLKSDKISLLLERTNTLRRSLAASNHSYARVLPVIVTNKSRESLATDLAEARRRGVVAITRDDLSALITHAEFSPDPEKLFQRGEDHLRKSVWENDTSQAPPLFT